VASQHLALSAVDSCVLIALGSSFCDGFHARPTPGHGHLYHRWRKLLCLVREWNLLVCFTSANLLLHYHHAAARRADLQVVRARLRHGLRPPPGPFVNLTPVVRTARFQLHTYRSIIGVALHQLMPTYALRASMSNRHQVFQVLLISPLAWVHCCCPVVMISRRPSIPGCMKRPKQHAPPWPSAPCWC